jgi:hypothetical protein
VPCHLEGVLRYVKPNALAGIIVCMSPNYSRCVTVWIANGECLLGSQSAGSILPKVGFKQFSRKADNGREIRFAFCSSCGGGIFCAADMRPGFVAIAIGALPRERQSSRGANGRI